MEAGLEVVSSPNSVVRDSAASRKSLVGMALSLLAWTGTSSKVLWSVSNHVPPDGKGTLCGTAMILIERTSIGEQHGSGDGGEFIGEQARGCRPERHLSIFVLEMLGSTLLFLREHIPFL